MRAAIVGKARASHESQLPQTLAPWAPGDVLSALSDDLPDSRARSTRRLPCGDRFETHP
jgi:hypothetical protein